MHNYSANIRLQMPAAKVNLEFFGTSPFVAVDAQQRYSTGSLLRACIDIHSKLLRGLMLNRLKNSYTGRTRGTIALGNEGHQLKSWTILQNRIQCMRIQIRILLWSPIQLPLCHPPSPLLFIISTVRLASDSHHWWRTSNAVSNKLEAGAPVSHDWHQRLRKGSWKTLIPY